MGCRNILLRVGIIAIFSCAPLWPVAVSALEDVPFLKIREIKINDEDFVVVQALSDLELSDYWVGYSSSDPLESLTPSEPLPTGTLKAGQAAILTSAEAVPTCDASLAMDLPFAFAETKGTFALWRQDRTENDIEFQYIDSAEWGTSTTKIKTTAPIDRLLEPDTYDFPVWFRDLSLTVPVWHIGNLTSEPDSCSLEVPSGYADPVDGDPWPFPDDQSTEPPVIVEQEDTDTPTTADDNLGLLSPKITELLVNPGGTGTDDEEEYIELYNPNESSFDLSGYTLETGLTTKHQYTIPDGTVLAGKSFMAFYAVETELSMSNTSGQAALLDRLEEPIAMTDPYVTAPDGQTWAIAGDEWYWTVQPTPGASNVITRAIATTTSSVKALTTKTVKAPAVKAASTKKASTAKPKVASTKKTTTKTDKQKLSSTPATATKPSSIHPAVLATVIAVAVGYGVYEYRHDLANRIHQLRSNRTIRRITRR